MKKVIIIGAGFAGLSAAQKLSRCGLDLEISIFDRKKEFNFLPLLPDSIGRGIPPEFLANDIAHLCRKLKINFIQEEVVAIDPAIRQIQTAASIYTYDYLVIASGSQPNFFSNPGASSYSYPLNNISDVLKIKQALEKNDFENIIICGAGYTGVEVATNLRRYFKNRRETRKIVIVEMAPAILGPLPAWMKDHVNSNLKKMGIEVLTASVIDKIFPDQVLVSGGRQFRRAMLIWVPGVRTAEFIQKLSIPKNPQGRVVVDEYLRIGSDCFCVGDAAFFGRQNNFLRMAVQFAATQGDLAAGNIIRSIKNKPLKKYRPYDLGYILPLANSNSCGRVLGLKVSGRLATWLHFSMCIFRSIGWRNRWGIMCNILQGGRKC